MHYAGMQCACLYGSKTQMFCRWDGSVCMKGDYATSVGCIYGCSLYTTYKYNVFSGVLVR